MSDRGSLENLKQEIVENIYTNENQAVTGDLLQDVLIDAVDTMGVSVSQNSETGHTEIHIGSDSYPVASVEEVSQLGQELSEIIGSDNNELTITSLANMSWGGDKVYPSTESWNGFVIPIYEGCGYYAPITGNIRIFNHYPKIDDTDGISVSSIFQAEIDGYALITLGTSSIPTPPSYTYYQSKFGLEYLISSINKDVEKLNEKVGDNSDIVISDFSSICYDGGSQRFILAASYHSIFVKLIKGVTYKIIGTGIANIRTFDIEPQIGLSAIPIHIFGASSEQTFIAGEDDKYLDVTGGVSSFTEVEIISSGGLSKNLANYVLKDDLGENDIRVLSSADFAGIIWDGGSGVFYPSSDRYDGIIIPLISGFTYTIINKEDANISNAETFSSAITIGSTQNAQRVIKVGQSFTATENEKFLMLNIALPLSVSIQLMVLGGELAQLPSNKDVFVVGFGDSIMLEPYNGIQPTAYIQQETGCSVDNCGFGGTRWKPRIGLSSTTPTTGEEAFNLLDLVNLINLWVNNNTSVLNDILSVIRSTQGDWLADLFAPGINILKTKRPTDFDVLMIMMGGNDLTTGTPLGDVDDSTIDTLCGCFNIVISTLLQANPKLKIYVFGNIVKWIGDTTNPAGFSDNWQNSLGYKMPDLNDKLQQMCLKYKLPFCNLYNEMGWNMQNFQQYFGANEGSHPIHGIQELGHKMGSFIKSNKIF